MKEIFSNKVDIQNPREKLIDVELVKVNINNLLMRAI